MHKLELGRVSLQSGIRCPVARGKGDPGVGQMRPRAKCCAGRMFQAFAIFLFAMVARAQTTATLTDLGATAPTPGTYDISQLSTSGEANKPDGLNYYTDNYPSHGGGAPGQTFTTGANAGGYWLNSVAFKTGGGSINQPARRKVIFSTSIRCPAAPPPRWRITAPATLPSPMATGCSGAASISNSPPIPFMRIASAGPPPARAGTSVANASNNPYTGGELALVPVPSGTITYRRQPRFRRGVRSGPDFDQPRRSAGVAGGDK